MLTDIASEQTVHKWRHCKPERNLRKTVAYRMSSFKAKLKAAKEFYVQHKYREALERCTSALQDNEESTDGLL